MGHHRRSIGGDSVKKRRLLLLVLASAVLACGARREGARPTWAPQSGEPDDVALTVSADDRSPEDRALDIGRRPAELLRFADIRPGMRVAEISAGAGYTSELLARGVGSSGAVYGHNAPVILERFAEAPWRQRLKKPVMARVVRLDRPFDDPFPPEIRDLDAVLLVLFYHDTVWLNVDRNRMNRAVFNALRPGGVYVIVDHSSWPGRGTSEAQTLHRIDETLVREEVEEVGFELVDQGFFLRNPEDKRDWNAAPNAAGELRGTSDRFVLKFAKPATLPIARIE
jgi:predicted methyltransferase